MISAILRICTARIWQLGVLSERSHDEDDNCSYVVGLECRDVGTKSGNVCRLGFLPGVSNARDNEVCLLVALKALSPARQSWRESKQEIDND